MKTYVMPVCLPFFSVNFPFVAFSLKPRIGDVRFAPKLGQIGPKFDKYGTIQIRFKCISTFWRLVASIWREDNLTDKKPSE